MSGRKWCTHLHQLGRSDISVLHQALDLPPTVHEGRNKPGKHALLHCAVGNLWKPIYVRGLWQGVVSDCRWLGASLDSRGPQNGPRW